MRKASSDMIAYCRATERSFPNISRIDLVGVVLPDKSADIGIFYHM